MVITATGSGVGPTPHAVTGIVGKVGANLARQVDAAYFDSYSYFDIHHEMLSDKVGVGCSTCGDF